MAAPVLSFDTGHEDMIHDAQLNYYGERLATSSSDHTARVWDVTEAGQKLTAELKGHKGPVWQVAWAHPRYGSILATCSYDRKVIIWKETSPNVWTKVFEYSEHELSVNCIAWASHELGLWLACGSSDGNISVLSYKGGEWETVKLFAHAMGVNGISWHPQKASFVTGGSDNLIKIWRRAGDKEWEVEETLEGHKDWVRDVAWAPLPANCIASASQDNTVMIWKPDGENGKWTGRLLNKFTDVVWRVSWSLTGNILAVSCADNNVSLWKEGLDLSWSRLSTFQEDGH